MGKMFDKKSRNVNMLLIEMGKIEKQKMFINELIH